MITLKKVEVVIDPNSESQPSLDKALILAKLQDFEIKLIACEYSQYLVEGYYFDAVDIPRLRDEYLEEHRNRLETLAAPLRENGIMVTTEALWGHPGYEVLIKDAVSWGADLVIHNTRRHSALSRLFLTNDDWQLVRCCPVPLLLVKDKLWKDKPAILAAVDPSHGRHKPEGLDHKILRVSSDLKELLDGDMFVLHAYGQIPLSGTYPKQAKVEHEKSFTELMSDFEVPRMQQHLMEEIPEYALRTLEKDLQADLVVMGGISRNILSEAFIGSTTEKVLDYLECDVLVLKPDNFISPVK